jgi:hypothetical protein
MWNKSARFIERYKMAYKRFMLFAYEVYYPAGGVGDCITSFNTLEDAIAAAKQDSSDVKNILDLDERRIVWREND